ncbi:MAG: phage holin family protein [Clostridiales bacterium]|nr:phage holin family protein [Clostridiales bacterium]MCF8023427.1 phage holin family protein [Clostridiales bacterium]
MNWITMILLNTLSIVLADFILNSIELEGFIPALLAGFSLGIVNTIIRPVLMLFTLPLTILTMGLFVLLLNAMTFGLAAFLVPGFHIYTFGGAFWGAIFTSIIGWILNLIFVD